MSGKQKIAVVRSYQKESIGVSMKLSARDWNGDAIQAAARTDITTAEALALADALIAAASEVNAKMAKRDASDARRRRWREREIAAGRMVVL